MSQEQGEYAWVSDLDDYIDLDNLDSDDEYERTALQKDLDGIGDIRLFSEMAISERILNGRGIYAKDWRWAIHQAENALHEHQNWSDLEAYVLKDLLNLGRRYAVARYAKWEAITYNSAITATLPHGFNALLNQFLMTEKVINHIDQRRQIHSSIWIANAATDLTAYHRTAIFQAAIHQSANEAHGVNGYRLLDKDRMRNILSLARLRYSISEIVVQSLRDLNNLDMLYEKARIVAQSNFHSDHIHMDARFQDTVGSPNLSPGAREIKNWGLRHIHPLTYFYPYSIRHAILRAKKHLATKSLPPSRTIAVNELALARCGMRLMRRSVFNGTSPITPSK